MTLHRALQVLWARRARISLVVAAALLASATASLLMPKTFEAEATLVVDFKGSDPLAQSNLSSPLLSTYMATQREILASRNVALKVIADVGVRDVAALFGDAQPKAPSAYVAELLAGLTTSGGASSNIIRVTYGSTDPQLAARIANAFAAAYIQTSLELQVDPARRQTAWFEEQVQALRQDLAQAQSRLDGYQRNHGVLDVDQGRIDVENVRLQEIASQLVKAQATMYDAETRKTQARGSEADLPDLLQNPLLQNLKSELARAEARLADLSERVDRNHPQYRSASAEVAMLRSKLNAEVGVAKASLTQSADIAVRQVREVQQALNEQRQRIIALRQQRDELAVLNRDVESARAAYDAASQQANQTRLQSRVNRTNIAILTAASVPTWAAAPRLGLNLALAFVVGTVLAAAQALYAEHLQPRLRHADDLPEGEWPLLAELPALPADKPRAPASAPESTPRLQPQMRPRLT